MSEEVSSRRFLEEPRNRIERREEPQGVVLVACMDEALRYGPGVFVAGVAGSAVTQLEAGDQAFFPDEKRRLVEEVRPLVYRSLDELASGLGYGFGVTSHDGCGWAGAQGIESSVLPEVTKALVQANGKEYVGHIPYGERPVALGRQRIKASNRRLPSDHHHDARSIVLTVGGFVTQDEIDEQVIRRYGKPFIISADWIAEALKMGADMQKALDFLELEIDIASGISKGLSKAHSVFTFDAERLGAMTAIRNRSFVRPFRSRVI